MYRTQEEATSGGDANVISQTVRAKADKESREARIELERIKTQAAIDDTQRTKELAELKHQQQKQELTYKTQISELEHRLEATKRINTEVKEDVDIRKNQRSDYYDERSYQRKDSSELIKYIPAILLGVGGLFTYMGKFK
jgi:predicted nucleic acid-binding protein